MKLVFDKWVTHFFEYWISFFFMALMMITAVDVIGRYIFDTPLPGSTELTEFCLGLIVFSSLPLICRSNQHITVDLFESKISERVKLVRDFLIQLFTIGGLGFLGYGIYILATRARRDSLVSEYLGLPVAFFYYLTTFLIFVSMLATVLHFRKYFYKKSE